MQAVTAGSERAASMGSGQNFIARGGVWRLAFGLAAACGADAEPGSLGGEGGSAGAASGGSAGAGAESSMDVCPRPVLDIGGPTDFPVWARAYPSGVCCPYDDQVVAPEGWPTFFSAAECESSCRCAELEGGGPGVTPHTERISLECACSDGECVATPEAAVSVLCERGGLVTRSEGCGLVSIAPENGLFGQAFVFDASSSALVGTTTFSDSRLHPCGTFSTRAGAEFSCGEAVTCRLCGGEDTTVPPCE